MDSEVSILNFSTKRKVLSLLRYMTGLHFWLGLGTRNRKIVKPKRLGVFYPFYCTLAE